MDSAPAPAAESARLAALERAAILHTPPEPEFDLLTRIAAELCGTPLAFITFIDAHEVWSKSWHGTPPLPPEPREDAYCDQVVRHGQPLHVSDAAARGDRPAAVMAREGLHMYTGVPLFSTDQHAIGTLCVLDTRPRDLDPTRVDLLQALAGQVMALVELRQTKRELEASLQTMERLATTDELTGLMNRRRLLQKLEEECARARRSHEPLAVVLIDLDHFKAVNDRHGHAAGDHVLANTGRLILDTLRATDSAGRYGGEELCLVLPNTAADGARNVAELMRLRLEALAGGGAGEAGYITGSFGVAVAATAAEFTAGELLARADAAMYRAKQAGRNRVELAPPATD